MSKGIQMIPIFRKPWFVGYMWFKLLGGGGGVAGVWGGC